MARTPKTQTIKPPAKAAAKPRRGYGGLTPEQQRAERRQRLLATALELFGTQGYHATSIETLCAQARVTSRHFYEEFNGREGLFDALYAELMRQVKLIVLQRVMRPAATPQQQIEEGLAAFIHAYLDDPRVGRVVCLEVVGVSEAMARQRAGYIREFAQLIEAGILPYAGQGLFKAGSYHLKAIAMAGAVNELIGAWLLAPQALNIDDVTRELIEIFTTMLTGMLHMNQPASPGATAKSSRRTSLLRGGKKP